MYIFCDFKIHILNVEMAHTMCHSIESMKQKTKHRQFSRKGKTEKKVIFLNVMYFHKQVLFLKNTYDLYVLWR